MAGRVAALCLVWASQLDGAWARFSFPNLFKSWPSAEAQGIRQHVLGSTARGAPQLQFPFPSLPSRNTTGFLALGDSYSAGIGTGVEGTEDDCRRGLHAHPMLIFDDITAKLGENSTVVQFLSCTGSTTEDVLAGGDTSQIETVNTTEPADFALLSVGGNDLGFFDVMNACIFRFYSFYSGTCEAALENADRNIRSDEFDQRLQMIILEILDRVQWEKKPWFTITVTGYAQFFNAESEECDQCSFGIWWHGPKLKRELRRRVNDMVLAVNNKIQSSIDMINARFTGKPKVFFVNYDARFEHHRFCEPNVTEPAYNRTDTWFFLVGGTDNAPDGTPEQRPGLLAPDSPLVDPNTCLQPALRSGDWGELALCYMAMARRQDPTLQLATQGGLKAANSMWYVPTYYGKTFHPRSRGHEVIRDEIYKLWATLGRE